MIDRMNLIKTEIQNDKIKSMMVGTVGLGVVMLFFVIVLFLCVTTISPGYAGVIYNRNGGLEDRTIGQGWHVVPPWKKIIAYPISTETVYMSKAAHEGRRSDDSLWVNTRDGKQVNVDITYSYHMSHDRLPDIFTKFRGQDADMIEWGYMKNEVYRVVNEITSQYSMMDLVGDKRPEVNAKCFEYFRRTLGVDGIIVETFNLSRVEPDQQTLAAIQAVVNAQNALKQAEIEKQKAEIEAERKRIEARGTADATLIAAQGQAEANNKLQQSLTDNIVRLEWIKKWDGRQPTTELGGGSAIVNLK